MPYSVTQERVHREGLARWPLDKGGAHRGLLCGGEKMQVGCAGGKEDGKKRRHLGKMRIMTQ